MDHAVKLLRPALAKNPDDPVALFNRAIALEKTYAYDEAIRDWEHYLRWTQAVIGPPKHSGV